MRKIKSEIIFLLLFPYLLFSQNLDKIGEKDALKINGSVNYNSVFYDSYGIDARRNPFTWYLNGNINFSLLDWSIPFTYSYSNQHGTFTQPFNQYGLMPQYKWFKGYAGYSNITFSPYTLSGYVFVGGAAELMPQHWRLAAMYGRLNKALDYDYTTNSYANMAYERWGKGIRCGYENKGSSFFLNYFSAKDEASSLLFVPSEANLLPQENTVLSIEAKATVSKYFLVETEYALSGITRNAYSEYDDNRKNYLPGLFKMKSESYFAGAYKASIGYRQKLFTINAVYERIAPDYLTLGAYYFNNDLENITIAPSFKLLKEKLSLSLNTGLQRNNLDGKKLNTVKRWVGSANVSYNAGKKLMIAGNYSNFTSYTKLRPPESPYSAVPVDTLSFYQLSQNGNITIGYNLKRTDKCMQSLTCSALHQVTGEVKNNVEAIPSNVINVNAGYLFNRIKNKETIMFIANINQSNFLNAQKTFLGPGASYSKQINNCIKASYVTNFNLVFKHAQRETTVINNRLNISWSPKSKNEKKDRYSLSASLNDTYFLKSVYRSSSNEFTALFNLSYSF